jgi:hypothetical protein
MLITVASDDLPQVYLDDQLLTVVWRAETRVGAAQTDLSNQVGYHRLRVVSGHHVVTRDFQTTTAKATWDEILEMADVCTRHYLGYRRQFMYMASTGEIRRVYLPQVEFAWLRERVPEILSHVRSIVEHPAVEPRPMLRTSVRARRVSIPATIRLLHERSDLLEERQDGPLEVDGVRYWPSMVRVSAVQRLPAAREHAQIARFLALLIGGLDRLSPGLEEPEVEAAQAWRRELASVASAGILRRGAVSSPGATPSGMRPSPIQLSDRRYGRLRKLSGEYCTEVAGTDREQETIRGNLKDVWEIYQTFVAHVVGKSLRLRYVDPTAQLRKRGPLGESMAQEGTSLYFDHTPPRGRVKSRVVV